MRSKASFRGHPNHPALIPFPLAFLTGAFLFDVVGVVFNRPALWTTGAYLIVVGVIAGVFAAIPGLIDFLYTVPPNSSGKKRALKHASAKHIGITLSQTNGRVALTVNDDGVGLPAEAAQRAGMGLNIMAYRARMIGGSLEVQRGGRGGTVVSLVFPSSATQA